MITKEQQMRFILEDEPNRIKREYRGEILNIHYNISDEKSILYDGKPKQKVLTKDFYRRNKQF